MTTLKIDISGKRIGFMNLPLEQVIPSKNYRDVGTVHGIEDLGDSFRKVGQIQPALVNKITKDGEVFYELFAGNRRYLANVLINSKDMPCVVYENLSPLEKSLMQLSENIKKRIDPAGKKQAIIQAVEMLDDLGEKPENWSAAAEALGIPRATIYEARCYSNLNDIIKQAEEKGLISFAKAIEIGRLVDNQQQKRVYEEVLMGRYRNSRVLSLYVSSLISMQQELPETFSLTPPEEDRKESIKDKIKEYGSFLERTTSYLRSLSFMLKTKPELKAILKQASLNKWKLGELTQSILEYTNRLEEKLKQYNPKALEQALKPKKKKTALKEILEKRKILEKQDGYEVSVNELLKEAEFIEINIELIDPDPNQPRKTKQLLHSDSKTDYYVLQEEYDEYTHALGDNISAMGGVETPIRIRRKKDTYQIIVGESRYWGSMKAGQKTIPALLSKDIDDVSCKIIQLEEDLHEKDSSAERGQALSNIKNLLKGTNEKDFAKFVQPYLGLRPSEVSKYIKLLRLNKRIQDLFYTGRASFTGVLELARVNKGQREYLCDIILADSLGTREIKNLVDNTIQANNVYSFVSEKEKEFLEQCESAGKEIAKKKIIKDTIESMAGLQMKLNQLPEQEEFYKDDRIVNSYASFNKTLAEFNQEINT